MLRKWNKPNIYFRDGVWRVSKVYGLPGLNDEALWHAIGLNEKEYESRNNR